MSNQKIKIEKIVHNEQYNGAQVNDIYWVGYKFWEEAKKFRVGDEIEAVIQDKGDKKYLNKPKAIGGGKGFAPKKLQGTELWVACMDLAIKFYPTNALVPVDDVVKLADKLYEEAKKRDN